MILRTNNATYLWNVPGEPSGVSGGEGTPSPASSGESAPAAIPSLPQAVTPGVGSTADPPGMVDETLDWIDNAFHEMQREEVIQPLDDVVHAPAPLAPQNPGQTPATAGQQPPVVQTAPQASPQIAQTTANPATQPVLPPTAPVAAVPPQAPQPAQLAPTPQPPQAVRPVDQGQVFDRLSNEIAKNQAALTQHLADVAYKLSDADAEAMGFTPEQAKAVAQMQAKVQVNVTGSVMRIMTQQMPNYVAALLQRRAQVDEGAQAFWKANPHLNAKDHEAAAIQVGTAFRQMNPQASSDEFNRFVGDFVGMRAGLVRPAPGAPPQPQPTMPAVRTPGPVVRPNGQMPYQPAGVHAAPASSLPNPQENEWTKMERVMRAFDGGLFDN